LEALMVQQNPSVASPGYVPKSNMGAPLRGSFHM
jgi:hypothetical protein